MKELRLKLLFLVTIFAPLYSNAQFVYLGTGAGYTWAQRVDNLSTGGYGTKRWDLNFQGMYRPIRHLGLGFSFASPSYIDAPYRFPAFTTVSSSDHWSSYWIPGGFMGAPIEYGYYPGPIISITARGFLETTLNMYADIRLSFTSSTEKVKLIQQGWEAPPGSSVPPVEQVNIDHEHVHRLMFPSIHVGLMPHVFKHFYLDLSAGIQFIVHNSDFAYSFNHHAYDQSISVVTLSSPIPRRIQNITLNFGGGYFF